MQKHKRKCKKLFSLVLILAMLFSLSNVTAFAADSDFAGGTGTPEDPYQIENETQLFKASGSYSYILKNDITITRNSAVGSFSGTFDGNGHTLNGLQKQLFTTLTGNASPTIKNLNIIYQGGGDSTYAGTVFAKAGSGTGTITLTNIHVTITGSALYSGLAGDPMKRPLQIENCSVVVKKGASIDISYNDVAIAGGLSQHLRGGSTLKNSFVYVENGGKIEATTTGAGKVCSAGGLVGAISNQVADETSIENCYVINQGTIQANVSASGCSISGAGGIAGTQYSNSSNVNISNSYVYNAGTIGYTNAKTGATNQVGILAGHQKSYESSKPKTTLDNLIGYSNSKISLLAVKDAGSDPEGTYLLVTDANKMTEAATYSAFNLNGAGTKWLQNGYVSPVYGSVAGLEGLPYLIMEFYRGPYDQAEQSLSSDDTYGDGIYTVSYKLDKIRAVSGELTVTLPASVKLMNGAVEATGTDVTDVVTGETGITVDSANLNGNTLTITWGVATNVTPHCVDALYAKKSILSVNVKPTALTAETITASGSVVDNNNMRLDTHKETDLSAIIPAATYTVSFDANGHGTAPAAQSGIAYEGKATEPTAPTAAGYTFGGWYKEAGCTTAWNFKTDKVTADTTLYAKWTANSTSGGGGGIYIPPVQKPVIDNNNNAKTELSGDGTKLTIKAEEGYKLVDVIVNGVSKGAVDTLTGLKTGDKVVVVTEEIETEPTIEEVKAELGTSSLVARSQAVTLKNGKKAIKITWYDQNGNEVKFDGVEIYRSTKRNTGYGKKPIYVSKSGVYYNTSIKPGTKYYYRVRGFRKIDGQKYYTNWSLKAFRAW